PLGTTTTRVAGGVAGCAAGCAPAPDGCCAPAPGGCCAPAPGGCCAPAPGAACALAPGRPTRSSTFHASNFFALVPDVARQPLARSGSATRAMLEQDTVTPREQPARPVTVSRSRRTCQRALTGRRRCPGASRPAR